MVGSVLLCVVLIAQGALGASVGDAQKPAVQQDDKPSPSTQQCVCPSKVATQITNPVIKFAVDIAPSLLHLFTLLNGINGGGSSTGKTSASAGSTGRKNPAKSNVDRSGSSAREGGGSIPAGSEGLANAISGLTAQSMQSLGNAMQQGPAIGLDLIRELSKSAGNAMNAGNNALNQGINAGANLLNTLLRSGSPSSSSSTAGNSGQSAGSEGQANAISGLTAKGMQALGQAMQQGPAIGLELFRALSDSAGNAMNAGNNAANQGINAGANLLSTLLSGGSGLMNAAIKDGANTLSNGINAAAGVTGTGLKAAGGMMEQMTRGISPLLVPLGEKLALSISQAEKMAAELLNNAKVVDGAVKFNSTSQRDMYNSTDQFVKVLVNIQDWINRLIASTPKPSGQLQVSIKAKAGVGLPPGQPSPKAKTP